MSGVWLMPRDEKGVSIKLRQRTSSEGNGACMNGCDPDSESRNGMD